MRCAIMQPTYFPWAGYFNLISKVDYFVFLDDAQFQKGSWHNRNRVLANGIPTWITIPVLREFLEQKICDSKIDDTKTWRKKHFNLITQNYAHHEYYHHVKPIVEMIQDESIKILSQLNIKIICAITELLNLNTKFILSSEMNVAGVRSERIVNICKQLDCKEYVSPPGAKEYLEEDRFADLSSIKLTINDYSAKPYSQEKTKNFESYLSIIDVISNLGMNETLKYVSSNES